MWFRLAAILGGTVEELQERMTWREFIDWCGFYLIEPWGCEIEDFRASLGPHVTAQVNAPKGKRYKLTDFQRHRWADKRVDESTEDKTKAALGAFLKGV